LTRPALCAALLAAGGCYAHRPAGLETVTVGTDIRALLATEARIGLEDRLRLRLEYLNGRLVERNGDSLLVEVRSLSATDGRPLYQRIGVAQADVLRVDVKRLDKVRTIALAAGLATLAVLTVATGFWSTGIGDGDGGGPNEAPPTGGGPGPLR
jgi:hypothetical protein